MQVSFVTVNALINGVISALATIANALIIYTFINKKSLRNVTNSLLFQLAIMDFIKASVLLPIKTYNQINNKETMQSIFCQFSGVLSCMITALAALLLAAIAVVRYYKLVKWEKFERVFTKKRTVCYSSGMYFATLMLAFMPVAVAGQYSYSRFHGFCFADWSKQNIPFRSLFYTYTVAVAYLVIIYCYARLFTVIKSYQRMLGRPTKKRVAFRENRVSVIGEGSQTKLDVAWGGPTKDVGRLSIIGNGMNAGQASTFREPNVVMKGCDGDSCECANKLALPDQNGSKARTRDRSRPTTDETQSRDRITNKLKITDLSDISEEESSKPKSSKVERTSSMERQAQATKQEIHVTKVMFTIVLAYSCCWLPIFILTIMKLSGTVKAPENVVHAAITLVELKTLINPLIYGIWNCQFRSAMKSLFLRCDEPLRIHGKIIAVNNRK